MSCTVLCDCGVTSSLSGCHWESERSPILCLAGVLSSPLLNVCTCSTCTCTCSCTVWTRVPVNGPRQPRSNRLCQTAPTRPEPIRYIQIKSYLTECTQNIGKPAVCGHPVACKGGGGSPVLSALFPLKIVAAYSWRMIYYLKLIGVSQSTLKSKAHKIPV